MEIQDGGQKQDSGNSIWQIGHPHMFGCPLCIHNTKKACFVRLRGCTYATHNLHVPIYWIHPLYVLMPSYVWTPPYVWMSPVCFDAPICLDAPKCMGASKGVGSI